MTAVAGHSSMQRTLVVAAAAALLLPRAGALDNGFRTPAMGWSSWYGFTNNINEALLRDIADGLVSSGLRDHGFRLLAIDDGWALPRMANGTVTVDPAVFPSGMAAFVDYVHARGLLFGIYTSVGPLTCLAYQPTQPKRPGSCGYETLDAATYAAWGVDFVKNDGCGSCSGEPYVAMRDALNATGRRMYYEIHAGTTPGSPNGTVANDWRTGDDLYSSSFAMWTNRLDLATAPAQAALAGPGSFPNPDFLEVGYSPRAPKGAAGVMSALEQRSMFTMWAALPTALILSADVRAGAPDGGVDADALATLTNDEVIAVNQDALAAPMRCVFNATDGALQVWRKPLAAAAGAAAAVVLFHRGADTSGPLPQPPAVRAVAATWAALGLAPGARVAVRDLWAKQDLGVFTGPAFTVNVTQRDARLYSFVPA
jgi:alpha-galactosidase